MIKLSPEGEYHIIGRGLIFGFKEMPPKKGTYDPGDWKGEHIEIKGIRYEIRGVEMHMIPTSPDHPYKGPVGFLVRPV